MSTKAPIESVRHHRRRRRGSALSEPKLDQNFFFSLFRLQSPWSFTNMPSANKHGKLDSVSSVWPGEPTRPLSAPTSGSVSAHLLDVLMNTRWPAEDGQDV